MSTHVRLQWEASIGALMQTRVKEAATQAVRVSTQEELIVCSRKYGGVLTGIYCS